MSAPQVPGIRWVWGTGSDWGQRPGKTFSVSEENLFPYSPKVPAGDSSDSKRPRRADVAFVAPLLGLGLQFALHAVYGREYVLYSLHWHSVGVAVLVAATWNGFASARRALAIGRLVLAVGLAVNNWQVLDGIYREFEYGLESSARIDEESAMGGLSRIGPGVVLFSVVALSAAAADYDLVLRGGRVLDPETGTDAVLNVGVRGGEIAAISPEPLSGRTEIDATGLVVAPGFIDLHTHSPTPLGQHYQLMDGVTTALELEVGAYPVGEFALPIRGQAPIHYGASVGFGSIRLEVKLGLRQPHVLTGKPRPLGAKGYWTALRSLFVTPDEVFVERATPRERERMRSMLHEGLDAGGLGIGVPLDYFSEAVDRDELRMVFEVAGERRVPLFIHVRRGVNGDPSGLREALELAEETRAPVHICHLSHNAMRNTALFLAEIRAAREAGVDVTAELLPYNAGSALISSAVFGRDWRTIFAIDYGDVEWAATGERFTESMWEEYREKYPDGQVIHHYVEEAWTRTALVEPGVIVVSDLLPMITEESKVAPHNGAFSRILGRYVREEGLLDLEEALAKMTLLPARRLERAFPAFEKKGRVQVGADADLTLFDPDRIIDRATYQNPYQTGLGILHVLVAGEVVVRDGSRIEGVLPGRFLLFAPNP